MSVYSHTDPAKKLFNIHIMHYIIRPYLWPVSHSVPDHCVQILWKQTRSTALWSSCDEGLLWEECSWAFWSSTVVNHKWEMTTEYCLIGSSCKGKEQFHCYTFYHTFSQIVSKMKSIPHGVIFTFPRVRKPYGILRIADFLLSYYFSYKNWNYIA